jgi:hypothetical protein
VRPWIAVVDSSFTPVAAVVVGGVEGAAVPTGTNATVGCVGTVPAGLPVGVKVENPLPETVKGWPAAAFKAFGLTLVTTGTAVVVPLPNITLLVLVVDVSATETESVLAALGFVVPEITTDTEAEEEGRGVLSASDTLLATVPDVTVAGSAVPPTETA